VVSDGTAPRFSGDGGAIGFLSRNADLPGGTAAGVQEAYVNLVGTRAIQLASKNAAGAPANADVQSIALGGTVPSVNAPAWRAVFQTGATNLGGTLDQSYVRDVKTATTSLLNRAAGADGAPGDGVSADPPAISADGTTALFGALSSNLGDGAVGRFTTVHVRELSTPLQAVELVSRPSGSGPLTASGSDDSSFRPSGSVVSADGRFVAFESQSDALSPIDDNRSTNVFVRDLLTGHTVLVSRATGGAGIAADADSSVAGISADGRRVAFTSSARDLSPDANGAPQAYVRDLDANTTTLVSRATGGAGAVSATGAFEVGISASGNAVVMTSRSALDPAGAGGVTHVYVRDLAAQATTLADRESGIVGPVPSVPSGSPVLDADGGVVAWVSTAALADAPADGRLHVYIRDLRTHQTALVSRASGVAGASADGDSTSPAIDAAGDVVAFASPSPNLGATASAPQVFARDVAHSQTELISRAVDGGPELPAAAESPSIDAAGDRIAFLASGAIETPPTTMLEAYVRDRRAQTTKLVSQANGTNGALADANTTATSISGSGDCVAFAGRFTNLGDGFGSPDFSSVHLRTLRNTCPGAGGTVTTPPPPTLSALSFSHRRFHATGRGSGTMIFFALSRSAVVTLHFERLVRGHRKGGRCVLKGHGKRCTIVIAAGTLRITGHSGRNRLRFAGRLKGRALRAGEYRLTATPAHGRPRATGFTVIAVRSRRTPPRRTHR
jgi:TolB protein